MIQQGPAEGQSLIRHTYLDVAKGLGIWLVVIGHSFEMMLGSGQPWRFEAFALWKFIYAFHMPLFFLLSGWVTGLRPRRLEKIVTSSVWLVMLAAANHVAGWVIERVTGSIGIGRLVGPLIKMSNFETMVVWFLVALAFCQLIYALMKLPGWPRWAAVILTTVLFVLDVHFDKNVLQGQALLPALIFYGLGVRLEAASSHFGSALAYWTLGIAGLAFAVLASTANRGCVISPFSYCPNFDMGFASSMKSGDYGFLPIFMVGAVAGAIGIVHIAKALADHSRTTAFLRICGENSLAIMLVNGFGLQFVQPLLAEALLTPPVPWHGITAVCGLSFGTIAVCLAGRRWLACYTNGMQTVARKLVERVNLLHGIRGTT